VRAAPLCLALALLLSACADATGGAPLPDAALTDGAGDTAAPDALDDALDEELRDAARPADSAPTDGADACSPPPPAAWPAFTPVATVPVAADGRTAPVVVPVAPGAAHLLVRVSAGAETARHADVCYQLSEVVTSTGQSWVPALPPGAAGCPGCVQRVTPGRGYGLFTFPNDGSALPDIASLSLRVDLLECVTRLPAPLVVGTDLAVRLPAAVVVETAALPAPPDDAPGTLALRLHVTEGARSLGLDDAGLADLLREAADALDPAAGLTLVAGPPTELPGGDAEPLRFTAADQRPLDALVAAACAVAPPGAPAPDGVPVFVVGCLELVDPALGRTRTLGGYATRIPGGSPRAGLADGVFLALGDCGAADGVALRFRRPGVTLAHELGHYLGLVHTIELDGSEDHLPDTDGHPDNLMYVTPSEGAAQKSLSGAQIRVVRAHPAVSWTTPGEEPRRAP
jgi:hypothetical protein